jgi:hypothetical protein
MWQCAPIETSHWDKRNTWEKGELQVACLGGRDAIALGITWWQKLLFLGIMGHWPGIAATGVFARPTAAVQMTLYLCGGYCAWAGPACATSVGVPEATWGQAAAAVVPEVAWVVHVKGDGLHGEAVSTLLWVGGAWIS